MKMPVLGEDFNSLDDPVRRRVLFGLPAVCAVLVATTAAALDYDEPEAITGDAVEDVPFLMPLVGKEGVIALCVPASRIGHAYTYVLSNGTTILAERLNRTYCDDGSGWREADPGEFEGRIIGRIVTMVRRELAGWSEMGRGRAAG